MIPPWKPRPLRLRRFTCNPNSSASMSALLRSAGCMSGTPSPRQAATTGNSCNLLSPLAHANRLKRSDCLDCCVSRAMQPSVQAISATRLWHLICLCLRWLVEFSVAGQSPSSVETTNMALVCSLGASLPLAKLHSRTNKRSLLLHASIHILT